MKYKNTKTLSIFVIIVLILGGFTAIFLNIDDKQEDNIKPVKEILPEGVMLIEKEYYFSEPVIEENQGLLNVYVDESDFQSMGDGRPVIPINLTTYTFPFGTQIIDVEFEYSTPKKISISKKISYASCSTITKEDKNIYEENESYPSEYVSYHTGGGLLDNDHNTFLNIRVYPVMYIPLDKELHFTNQVKVKVYYKEPATPLLKNNSKYDLLIISPDKFSKNLKPLINHKINQNIETLAVTVEEIYEEMNGRDNAEKIKYYIKKSIEEYGIKSVLLVGGLERQSSRWSLPPRYSHVLIREGTQELVEPSFLSDLYFADIYDSEGNFSSWNTNNNDIFAEYENETIDEMDLYPDVHFGRLPCRNKIEVKTMVDKIINYETTEPSNWFDKIILVSGDHWADEKHISEGVLIMEKAKEIMTNFEPVELYATEENNILARDINKAINNGAGFAYFCGHGGPAAWGIHYPPDAKGWAPTLGKLGIVTFYLPFYMNFLRNKNKLPVTLVGGCNNGQYDVSITNNLKNGKIKFTTSCWAWKLTSEKRGGSIATIANTALGTHAMDDSDNNGINDYLEVYDGWLELNFFKLYSDDNIRILGQLHQEAITNYLNMFLGNHDEMDTKMVQQWQLFGDPSLTLN